MASSLCLSIFLKPNHFSILYKSFLVTKWDLSIEEPMLSLILSSILSKLMPLLDQLLFVVECLLEWEDTQDYMNVHSEFSYK